MEKLFLSLCLAILSLQVSAQDDGAAEVHFLDNSARHLQVGAQNVEFTCHLNQPVTYVLSDTVDTVLSKEWNGNTSEVHLFSNIKPDEANPNFYKMTYVTVEEGKAINFVLTILEVRHEDDGKLVCKTGTDPVSKDSVDIIVYRGLEKVHLQFGSFPAIMADASDETGERDFGQAMDAGVYPVICVAEGSNPGAVDVKLYLKGEEVPADAEVVVEPMSGNVRKFKSTIETTMTIDSSHTGHNVECIARAPGPNGNSIIVKAPIAVNVYDPVITCDDGEAYPGKRYVTISCSVDHTDIDVDGYYYRIGDTGVLIHEGDDKEVEGKVMMVKKETESPTKSKVVLELYEAADWHFSTDFVLVVESGGGHLTEEKVNLKKIEGKETDNGSSSPGDNGTGPEDSSAMMAASVVTLVLSLAATLFARVL